MNLIEILSILLIHWFADFVLQTDKQARSKSKDNFWLTIHVLTYSLVWLILSCLYFIFTGKLIILLFPIITFGCHWITDYFTSRLNSKLWNSGKTRYFFISVGFDQLLHYMQLFITYKLLT